jgi:uncharacterized protein (DUF2235 family)
MSRNLILCCDGTNNQFGHENTNVVRLMQVLDRDAARQRLYYDPGVGTLPEPGVTTRIGKRLSEWWGLAFGAGLTWKVQQAYSYLMDMWEPEDRVFLFGFSRGAYTVRVLAGLLHTLGLLPRGNQNLVPYVMRLFKSVRSTGSREGEAGAQAYWELCGAFRWTFARPTPGERDDRRFRVHFLGIWDTVSSVGWVWEPLHFPYTARNPSITVIRHAVAIDERRWFFRQNLMEPQGEQDFQEIWFPGVHADVGGGYPEEQGGLWRMPFAWILNEAEHAGLLVDPQRLATVLNRTPSPPSPWREPQHESLTLRWWPAEFFPKLSWRSTIARRVPQIGLGRHRSIHDRALLHESTLQRIRETCYAPPNFSQEFLEKIRGLQAVPATLPFER